MLSPARQKVEHEGKCRVCPLSARYCDAAHTIDRSLSRSGFDDADLIVPLCSDIKGGAGHHQMYDAHTLDLLPYLTNEEQAAMVREVGMARAWRRVTGQSTS
jgi:hypothetical protein